MFKKITTLLLVVVSLSIGHTQELEFNQWQFAPALMNPALTGAYSGSFRVGAIIKDSWSSSIDSRSYKAMEGYVDAPIIRGFRKSDWIGVGIGFDMSQAGTLKLSEQYQRASVAYHFGFGKKYKSSFTIGGQFVNKTRKADFTNIVTPNSLEDPSATGMDPDLEQFSGMQANEAEANNSTWTAGIGYKAQLNKRNSWGFGLSLSQFLESDQSFGNGIEDLAARYIGYVNFKSITGKRTTFEPQALFSKQQGSSRLYLQGIFGYALKNKYVLKYGAGLNVLGAMNVPLYAGVEKGNFKMGLAYSVSLAEVEATRTYGGFELAASYIHILAKKPEPKPVLVCPRL